VHAVGRSGAGLLMKKGWWQAGHEYRITATLALAAGTERLTWHFSTASAVRYRVAAQPAAAGSTEPGGGGGDGGATALLPPTENPIGSENLLGQRWPPASPAASAAPPPPTTRRARERAGVPTDTAGGWSSDIADDGEPGVSILVSVHIG
jgi:hypothetical protein